jgi:hypothetical protein
MQKCAVHYHSVTADIIVAVFESQIRCWLDLAYLFLWAAFSPEWSSCGLYINNHRRARDCTLSLSDHQ